jgi:hypothetical protein
MTMSVDVERLDREGHEPPARSTKAAADRRHSDGAVALLDR